MGRYIDCFKILLLLFIYMYSGVVGNSNGQKEDTEYWNNMGQDRLEAALRIKPNLNVAKNVILFLGDGMGVSTVTASRILKGQLQNKSGEEENLAFDKFPYSCLIKTYNVNQQTPDSAGTATAFLSGVKTNAYMVGVGPSVSLKDCSTQHTDELTSILHWSQAEGKSVGVVTTTHITHATPAAAYAHSADRGWEGDSLMGSVVGGCKDIAHQLIMSNSDIQVILGGGGRFFVQYDAVNPVTNKTHASFGRRDGLNLLEEWKKDKRDRNKTHAAVYNKGSFDAVNPETTDYLLGIFQPGHMTYDLGRDGGPQGEPSIADMTQKAIQILQKNDKGFFLLVEGGMIDNAHHGSWAKRALYETVAFDKAIASASEITNDDETLTVVTADHSHVFVIGGYPSRGNPILGVNNAMSTNDQKPGTTLLYGTGPGYTSPREDITNKDIDSNTYRFQSAVPSNRETHGAEDVALYAVGPMSHLFHGVQEQNYIAHVMAYASCVGRNKKHCSSKVTTSAPHTSVPDEVSTVTPTLQTTLSDEVTTTTPGPKTTVVDEVTTMKPPQQTTVSDDVTTMTPPQQTTVSDEATTKTPQQQTTVSHEATTMTPPQQTTVSDEATTMTLPPQTPVSHEITTMTPPPQTTVSDKVTNMSPSPPTSGEVLMTTVPQAPVSDEVESVSPLLTTESDELTTVTAASHIGGANELGRDISMNILISGFLGLVCVFCR